MAVQELVRYLIDLKQKLKVEDGAKFFNYNGTELPYWYSSLGELWYPWNVMIWRFRI